MGGGFDGSHAGIAVACGYFGSAVSPAFWQIEESGSRGGFDAKA